MPASLTSLMAALPLALSLNQSSLPSQHESTQRLCSVNDGEQPRSEPHRGRTQRPGPLSAIVSAPPLGQTWARSGVGVAAGGSVLHVDDDASGTNDGSSWCDAYLYLQDALAAAGASGGAVTEIHVAQGIHKPDQGTAQTRGDREATFELLNGVALRGGYAGCGTPDPDERDFEAHETVLSGDLSGDDGPDFANNAENSYHVVTARWIAETAVLSGFTITGGNAVTHPHTNGGGMYCEGANPTVTDCTFSGNQAGAGGGISNRYSDPMLIDCAFSENSAIGSGSVWATGGGM